MTLNQPKTTTRRRRLTSRRYVIVALAALFTVLAMLPALFHWPAATPRISRTDLATELAYLVAALICFLIYRAESHRRGRRLGLATAFTVFFVTAVVNNVHRYNVDDVTNYVPYATNEQWQESTQNNVIALRPDVAPHSYRFLPNGMVRWLEMCHVSFRGAADIYRLEFGLLLFYAIFRFARLYTNFVGSILAMFIVAALFPVSFESYGGQLADPLSHLSFVLAFIFIETDNFPFLFATLMIGSLAKETVLAMAGYYVLFGARTGRFALKAGSLCAGTLLIYFGVRLYVLRGAMHYQNVSGVDMAHVLDNLGRKTWPPIVMLTAFGLIYFLILRWKNTPLQLKRLYFYLFPVLFLSSMLFSWLNEGRNYVPLVVVLAAIAGRFCATPNAAHCIEEVAASAAA